MCELVLHIIDHHLVDFTMPSTASVPSLSHLPTSMAAVRLSYQPPINTCPCTSTGHPFAQLNHNTPLVSLIVTQYPRYGNITLLPFTLSLDIRNYSCIDLLVDPFSTLLMLLHQLAAAYFHDWANPLLIIRFTVNSL